MGQTNLTLEVPRYFAGFWRLFRRGDVTAPWKCHGIRLKASQTWTKVWWGRVTHICVGNLTIIGSDNGLSPGRRQAITRTNAGILLIRPLRTNFSEILIEILIFSSKKMRLKVSSAKRRPFCLVLSVLTCQPEPCWLVDIVFNFTGQSVPCLLIESCLTSLVSQYRACWLNPV